jgi:hypothetical protein
MTEAAKVEWTQNTEIETFKALHNLQEQEQESDLFSEN